MGGKLTLRDILRRTLVGTPCALALLGNAACGQNNSCGNQVVLVQPEAKLPDGGLDCSVCAEYGTVIGCTAATVNSEPALSCNLQYFCGGITGRRPAWLVDARSDVAAGAGAYFAQAARLEAASVPAFRGLAIELSAHKAPSALSAWALHSAIEETRHARMTAALTRRFGATPLIPNYRDTPPVRTFEEIATENAVEGCVRETFGAALAMVQARHAQDGAVAATLTAVARDEIRHAELGWAVGDWMNRRLTSAARERVATARFQAATSLASEVSHASPELQRVAGLPSAELAAEMTRRFARALDAA